MIPLYQRIAFQSPSSTKEGSKKRWSSVTSGVRSYIFSISSLSYSVFLVTSEVLIEVLSVSSDIALCTYDLVAHFLVRVSVSHSIPSMSVSLMFCFIQLGVFSCFCTLHLLR